MYKNILEFLQVAKEIPMWDREPAISDSDLDKLLHQYTSIQKAKETGMIIQADDIRHSNLAAERRDAFLADIERAITVTQVEGGVYIDTGNNVVNPNKNDGSLKRSTLLSPCDLCMYNPPSSMGGKPCSICPACAIPR